jgi:glycosyltransferase involved in cell wall biosynthesis
MATGLGRWNLPRFWQPFEGVDVFHWPNFLLLPGVSGKQVITIYDLTFLLFPDCQPWLRGMGLAKGIAQSTARADMIIAISNHTKRDLVTHLGISEEKIRVIYCAVSKAFRSIGTSAMRPQLAKYGLPQDGYILYVGNIEPRKNLVRLLQAYSMMKDRGTSCYPLILCGGRGWKNKEVFDCVQRLSLEKEVKFIGYVPDEDLPFLMNGASLFVYPSLYEGFGLPPLEAMACGTPVVTSSSSSIPEVVGDAALMVDPHDVEGLSAAIERVLADKDLRADLRKKGLDRAKLFSWEKVASETLQVYSEVYAQGCQRS